LHDESPYFPETPRLNLLRQIDSLAREFCDVLATIIADGQTTSKRAGHHFGALTAVVAFLSQVGRRNTLCCRPWELGARRSPSVVSICPRNCSATGVVRIDGRLYPNAGEKKTGAEAPVSQTN
jgi:hypothetical protein